MRWLIDARPLADSAGGVGRVARGLVEAFVDLYPNDELILATTGSNATSYKLQATSCRHFHLLVPNKLWSAACYSGLTSLDREIEKRVGKIDGVFFPNIGFVGGVKRPYTLLLHDLSFLIEPKWFSKKMQLWHKAVRPKDLTCNAASLLAVSQSTKRDAIRLLGIPEEKILVIPVIAPHLDMGAGTVPAPVPAPGRYVLALGSSDVRKNTKTASMAVEILKKEKGFEDLELVLVGSNNRVSDNELAHLYRNAAAFLYPSWYEGYGLPLHEAANFGTPCIASTAGALPETAPPGTMFVDPAKPQHWVEALRTVLSRNSNFQFPISNFQTADAGSRTDPGRNQWHFAAKILRTALINKALD
ncbi:MAG: glycosyltransferase family 1 protein [Patescibacteria group bacterium]